MANNALSRIPFDKIGALTRVQRVAICIGTFVVLVGMFVYFIYLPKSRHINERKKELEDIEMRLASAKTDAKDLKKVTKQYEEAKGKFRLVLRLLPDKKEIPRLLEDISKSGRHSGLDFLLFKPGSEVNKGFYAEIPVKIDVQGGYHNLAMFFDKVARLSRIVNISDISIKSPKGSKQGQKMLRASCVATTYRFVEGGKKKKKKKK
ncbi:MAG: type 4a pilus biogenesis protein PilO [Deltaproteobacteria bacterium]|nr:type 4a pilus biogenesis protein PilO [Deltaproteobacteria bacterium]